MSPRSVGFLGGGLAAAMVLAIVLFVTCGKSGGNTSTTSTAQAGEIFLQPVASTGPNPFTPSVGASPRALTPVTPLASPGTPRSSPGGVAVQSSLGSTPGLYGGSNRLSSCDTGQLVSFLNSNPAKAAAWVAALNSDPTLSWSGGNQVRVNQIGQYVAELTPVVLRSDTRVTNHGFENGRPTPFQSVLQAGTAVLVDRYGIPRSRCACGNPLTPPIRVPTTPTYTGPPWPGFSPTTVVVVVPPPTIINIFVLVDIDNGGTIERPAGGNGSTDRPQASPSPGLNLTPPPNINLGAGDVQVQLLWSGGSDLDLHVTDPSGEEINFVNRRSASGGMLDHDDTAGCDLAPTTHVENIFWPTGGAPAGNYSAFVQNFSPCTAPEPYELRIVVNGRVVSDTSSTMPAQSGANSTKVSFTR